MPDAARRRRILQVFPTAPQMGGTVRHRPRSGVELSASCKRSKPTWALVVAGLAASGQVPGLAIGAPGRGPSVPVPAEAVCIPKCPCSNGYARSGSRFRPLPWSN